MRKQFRVRRTTLITVGCIAFLIGLGLARLRLNLPLITIILLLPLVGVSIHKHSRMTILFIILLGVCLGIVRGQMFMPNTDTYAQLNMQKVRLHVTAESDGVYDDKKQLSFDATHIHMTSPRKDDLVGKVKIAGFGENAIYKGDVIEVTGKLFQTRGSRQASIGFAEIRVIQHGGSTLDTIRRNFAAGLSNVLPEPQAPFGLGLLFGQRSTLGKEPTAWLAAVGLTHIIAVSGYNLTIIVRFIHRLFAKRSRYLTLLCSFTLVFLFLLVTGFSASIVRAAIVCGLSLVTWYYGRTIKPLLLIMFTAALTAGWYPYYLWSDIGWYLSFLAFFGVLILAPLLTRRLFKKPPRSLVMVLIESFSAQIMTVPLILYIFHQTSLIALVSNALVVPLVPLAMLLTLIAGICGMLLPQMLGFVALPARWILTYMLDVAHTLSKIPHVIVPLNMTIVVMVACYASMTLIVILMWHKTKTNHGIITDENLIEWSE